jgi:hypothetical protein
LLWLIANYFMEFHVGIEDCPPLTADMRVLLRKGYLRMDRNRPVASLAYAAGQGNRYNRLALTPSGRMLLMRAKVSEPDKDYIQRTQRTGVMR